MTYFLIVISFNLILGIIAEGVIRGNPTGPILATSYKNYSVTAIFPRPDSACRWCYSYKDKTPVKVEFWNSMSKCMNGNYTDIRVSCKENVNITSVLTFLEAYPVGLLRIELSCDKTLSLELNVTIKDCSNETLSNGVAVSPTSQVYGGRAQFSCPDGGTLFYSNGIPLLDDKTKCLAGGRWNGQSDLQCWKAPTSVAVNFLSSAVTGSTVDMMCTYRDVFPSGDSSRYFFRNFVYTLLKDELFTTPILNASDNGKPVYCHAVTPYTEVFPTAGKSPVRSLDVLYGPRNVTSNIITSELLFAVDGKYILRSDEKLSVNCLSDSNPDSHCDWLLCENDKICTNITSANSSCHFEEFVNSSSSIQCIASNAVGMATSSERILNVVPENRRIKFSVSILPENAVLKQNSLMINLGDSVEILCSIEYESELTTEYSWKLANISVSSKPVLNFPSVSKSTAGNYTCSAFDAFGNFEEWLDIKVIYKPYQDREQFPLSCKWEINKPGLCVVRFYSNPQAAFESLTKSGTSVSNDAQTFLLGNGEEQIFQFERKEVSTNDSGMYVLKLSSTRFPDIHTNFTFTVTMEDEPSTSTTVEFIVAASLASVLGVSLLVAIGVCFVRRRRHRRNDNVCVKDLRSPPVVMQISRLPSDQRSENVGINCTSEDLADAEHLNPHPLTPQIARLPSPQRCKSTKSKYPNEDDDGYLEFTTIDPSNNANIPQNNPTQNIYNEAQVYENVMKKSADSQLYENVSKA